MNYEKYLIAAGADDAALRKQALDYLGQCEQRYANSGLRGLKARAWLVVAWLLLRGKLPFEAEAMPTGYERYDNDVSINGDRGAWLPTPDGYADIQPCPIGDDALQYSYYPPHHPRSRWHRWNWLGHRNMCSRYASDLGPAITPEMRPRLRQWGDAATDRGHPGVLVSELDGHWCIYVVERAPLGLVVRRNVGVKLGLAANGLRRRAPLVLIKWSLLRAK
jgi:hypothetical protein